MGIGSFWHGGGALESSPEREASRFGSAETNTNGNDAREQARRWWNAWSDGVRGASAGSAAPDADWRQALRWWSQALPDFAPDSTLGEVLGKFNGHAGDWYARMQTLAEGFAGKQPTPREIVAQWRELLGANDGGNPFAEVFSALHGRSPHGLDAWIEQAAPWLQMAAKFAAATPGAGPNREQQARWLQLEKLLRDCQQRNADYNALLREAVEQAFVAFERKLGERAAAGESLDGARVLFDLWIDAAEEAYACIALSAEFRRALGELGNAQMRLRAAAQQEVARASELFGMPTRGEVDAAHRKIAELERALRKMQKATFAQAAQQPRDAARRGAAAKKAAAKKSPAKKSAKAARPLAKKVVAKKTVAKKTVAKRGARR